MRRERRGKNKKRRKREGEKEGEREREGERGRERETERERERERERDRETERERRQSRSSSTPSLRAKRRGPWPDERPKELRDVSSPEPVWGSEQARPLYARMGTCEKSAYLQNSISVTAVETS